MASYPLNRAPDVQRALAIASNDTAVELVIGQNTGRLTLRCSVDCRFSFRSSEGGSLDSTFSDPVVADTFFEVGVDKGAPGSVFVLVDAGAPATLSVGSEP